MPDIKPLASVLLSTFFTTDTMAPLEGLVGVGALLDAIMLGCLIVQSCVYYKNSRGDAWVFRILVSRLSP